jgi:hypothetical protein
MSRNFILVFYFQLFFVNSLRESSYKRKRGGAQRCSGSLGTISTCVFFCLQFLVVVVVVVVLGTLFFTNAIIFKNLHEFNVCVGFGWAVEIDLRVNHFFSCHLPLEWFVGPGLFFH